MSDRILITSAELDPPRRRRRWAGPTWMAIFALAIVGWIYPALDSPADAEPDPALVPEPFSPPEGTWAEIEFSGEGAFTSVLDSGSGLIAAGAGRRVDSTPFVWFSADGLVWDQASGPWQTGDLIAALVKGPSGLLAAGYRIDQSFRDNVTDAEPKVWSSSDGMSWESKPIAGLPPTGVVTAMVASADVVVAIGWEGPAALEPLSAPIPEATPRVWSSRDGTTWTDITPDGAASWFADVAATPFGFAVGGADDLGPSIWTFEQGVWTHVPSPEPSAEAVTAFTWRTDGLIALTRIAYDPEALVDVWSVGHEGSWVPLLTGIDRPGPSGWVATIDDKLFVAAAFTRSVISMGPELSVSRRGTDWVGVEVTAGVTPWPPPRVMSVHEFRGELYAFGSRGSNPTAWRLVDDGATTTR